MAENLCIRSAALYAINIMEKKKPLLWKNHLTILRVPFRSNDCRTPMINESNRE